MKLVNLHSTKCRVLLTLFKLLTNYICIYNNHLSGHPVMLLPPLWSKKWDKNIIRSRFSEIEKLAKTSLKTGWVWSAGVSYLEMLLNGQNGPCPMIVTCLCANGIIWFYLFVSLWILHRLGHACTTLTSRRNFVNRRVHTQIVRPGHGRSGLLTQPVGDNFEERVHTFTCVVQTEEKGYLESKLQASWTPTLPIGMGTPSPRAVQTPSPR